MTSFDVVIIRNNERDGERWEWAICKAEDIEDWHNVFDTLEEVMKYCKESDLTIARIIDHKPNKEVEL